MMPFVRPSTERQDIDFSGGLNTYNSPFTVRRNQCSQAQNVDISFPGKLIKRPGYLNLTSETLAADKTVGLVSPFEYDSSGARTQKLIAVCDSAIYKMDGLDGTFDDITNGVIIESDARCCNASFNNKFYLTDNTNSVVKIANDLLPTAATMPAGVTAVKFVAEFNNYLLYANCVVSGVRKYTRIYWSAFNDDTSFSSLDFAEIANDDGQEITGVRVLSDRLVVYKTRSIYNMFFTGDRDAPFTIQKSVSEVGCVSHWTIQDANGGHLFLSQDGVYFYDGTESFRVSDDITPTLEALNQQNYEECTACVFRQRDQYILSLPGAASSTNNTVLVFNYKLIAWIPFDGMNISSICQYYVNDGEERVYFGDYSGFVYRYWVGVDDYPLGVKTAIEAFWATNWRYDESWATERMVKNMFVAHLLQVGTLTVSEGFNLNDSYDVTLTINMANPDGDLYDSAIFDSSVYSGSSYKITIRDLRREGRCYRIRFENNNMSESFEIIGLNVESQELKRR